MPSGAIVDGLKVSGETNNKPSVENLAQDSGLSSDNNAINVSKEENIPKQTADTTNFAESSRVATGSNLPNSFSTRRRWWWLVGVVVLFILWGGLFLLMRHQATQEKNNLQAAISKLKAEQPQLSLPANAKFTNLSSQQSTVSASLLVNGKASVKGVFQAGSINTGGIVASKLSIKGKTVCSASGCTPSPGSSAYIRNGTASQTANASLQSASASKVGLVLAGQYGQIADLLQLQNSSGSVLARISSSGGLSVNSVSDAGGLTVSGGASVAGNISISGHYISGGSTPRVYAGSASDGGRVSVSGNDTLGSVSVKTGTHTSRSGDLIRVSFAHGFGRAPIVIITPTDTTAASGQYFVSKITTGGFYIDVAVTPYGNTNYSFNYFVGE